MPGGKLGAGRESRSTRETLPRTALILPVYRENLPARRAPSALGVRGVHFTVRVILRRFSWNQRGKCIQRPVQPNVSNMAGHGIYIESNHAQGPRRYRLASGGLTLVVGSCSSDLATEDEHHNRRYPVPQTSLSPQAFGYRTVLVAPCRTERRCKLLNQSTGRNHIWHWKDRGIFRVVRHGPATYGVYTFYR